LNARRAANAAKRSADAYEKTIRLTERADVLLQSAGVTFSGELQDFTGDSRLVLRFKNFGRTRAKAVSFRVRLIIPDVPDTFGPPLPSVVLAADQEQSISFERFRESLTEATFMDVAEGRITMRFESCLVYKDVFDSTYTTRDVGIFDPHTRTFRMEEQNAG
jgi:hypothetical protein